MHVSRLARVFLIAVLAMPALPAAAATTFSVSSFSHPSLGDTIGSGLDILSFAGASGSVDLTAATSLSLAELSFSVGPNCNPCSPVPGNTDTFSLVLGDALASVSLVYDWSTTNTADTVTFSPISPLRVDLAGQEYAVVFDPLAPLSSDGSTVPTELLTATITPVLVPVPEPATWALLSAGLLVTLSISGRRLRRGGPSHG